MKSNEDIEKVKKSCVDYYNNSCQDYYDEYLDELDKKPYDKDFLVRFVALINRNGNILDIGCCSTAQQARFFSNNGLVVTSIDLSDKCIETAKQNFKGINFLQMDMLDMNFENESFHAVNAFYSIIHIPRDKTDGLFKDFYRILRNNGKIALTVHAGNFYGYYDENKIPVFYRTYTQTDLRELLDKQGFRIIEIEQRPPIYDFEFQSERIYLIAEKIKNASGR